MTELPFLTWDKFPLNDTDGPMNRVWKTRSNRQCVEIIEPSNQQLKEISHWLTETFGPRLANGITNRYWEISKFARLEAEVHYNYKGNTLAPEPFEEQSFVPILQISLSEDAFLAFSLRFDHCQ